MALSGNQSPGGVRSSTPTPSEVERMLSRGPSPIDWVAVRRGIGGGDSAARANERTQVTPYIGTRRTYCKTSLAYDEVMSVVRSTDTVGLKLVVTRDEGEVATARSDGWTCVSVSGLHAFRPGHVAVLYVPYTTFSTDDAYDDVQASHAVVELDADLVIVGMNGTGTAGPLMRLVEVCHPLSVTDCLYCFGDGLVVATGRYCDCPAGVWREDKDGYDEIRRERGSLSPSPEPIYSIPSGPPTPDEADAGPVVMMARCETPLYCPAPVRDIGCPTGYLTMSELHSKFVAAVAREADKGTPGTRGATVVGRHGLVGAATVATTLGAMLYEANLVSSLRCTTLGFQDVATGVDIPSDRPYIMFPVCARVGDAYVPAAAWIDTKGPPYVEVSYLSYASSLSEGVDLEPYRAFCDDRFYDALVWKRQPVLLRNAMHGGTVPHPVPSFPSLGMPWLQGCMGEHFCVLSNMGLGLRTRMGGAEPPRYLYLEPISGAVYRPVVGASGMGEPVTYLPPVHMWDDVRGVRFGLLGMRWRERWL